MNPRWKQLIEGQVINIGIAVALGFLVSGPAFADSLFVAGDLVVSVEGCGAAGGTCASVPNGTGTGAGNSSAGGYGDNQAAPLTLLQYNPTAGTAGPATYVNSLVLPQTASGGNFAVSGEYGSSSEATLQLSGNGQYLTIMGYGINANTFNANPGAYGPNAANTALGQSGSMTGQAYTAVPRVVALIDANGNVNSSTGVYNVFDQNNPRSVYSANGTTFYISGQGNSPDATGGVFYTTLGSNSATPITGLDTNSKTSAQDTREVQIYNGQLYVSVDSKEGSGSNRNFIGTLGTAGSLPTSLANGGNGPTMLNGYGNSGGTGKLTITSGNTNGINSSGQVVNLSAENYFFASPSVLYVADSGAPKNDSGTSSLGDGGLQKWVNSKADGTGTWTLEYTLSAGLGLVKNATSDSADVTGTTGLFGLTGEVMPNGTVELFATNFTISDLDPTYLYGITDVLTATSPAAGEMFTELAAAPADSNFKGVSFAPTLPGSTGVPEPDSLTLLGFGIAALLLLTRCREGVQRRGVRTVTLV